MPFILLSIHHKYNTYSVNVLDVLLEERKENQGVILDKLETYIDRMFVQVMGMGVNNVEFWETVDIKVEKTRDKPIAQKQNDRLHFHPDSST